MVAASLSLSILHTHTHTHTHTHLFAIPALLQREAKHAITSHSHSWNDTLGARLYGGYELQSNSVGTQTRNKTNESDRGGRENAQRREEQLEPSALVVFCWLWVNVKGKQVQKHHQSLKLLVKFNKTVETFLIHVRNKCVRFCCVSPEGKSHTQTSHELYELFSFSPVASLDTPTRLARMLCRFSGLLGFISIMLHFVSTTRQ